MIRVGRDVVDQAGIGALHGLTERQARRRRPWADEAHPEPLTRGRPARGFKQVWDYEQAEAYARGETVPPLPTGIHARDLLDRFEAAEEAGVDPEAWRIDMYRDRVPEPDETIYDTRYWYRETVWDYRAGRATVRRGGGRPAGAVDTVPRGEIRERVAALLDAAAAAAEPISTNAIARELKVAYTTALAHVHAIRAERGQT